MDISWGDWFTDGRNYAFMAIAIPMVIAAIRVVTSSNVVHAVLFLVVALGGSAALLLLLGAEFVAWTVVLVYIGAVVVLFLFGIMITRAPMGYDVKLNHDNRWPALAVSLSVFALLSYSLVVAFENTSVDEGVARTGDIGLSLFQRFVLPFEIVSFLLLAALIGGIVLARKDPAEEEEMPA